MPYCTFEQPLPSTGCAAGWRLRFCGTSIEFCVICRDELGYGCV